MAFESQRALHYPGVYMYPRAEGDRRGHKGLPHCSDGARPRHCANRGVACVQRSGRPHTAKSKVVNRPRRHWLSSQQPETPGL